MAKKKTVRSSSKKGASLQTSSKRKSKPKSVAATKKKVATKSKVKPKTTAKTKTANPKNSAASKIEKKPVAKTKPKTSKTSKKPSLPKKTVKKSSASSTKKKSTTQRVKASKPKKTLTKNLPTTSSKPTAKKPNTPKTQPTKQTELSAIDRYHVGGLLACAIDQARDPGCQKLKKALKHLALSTQEQENLVRLTQGFMIPKLFADQMKSEVIRELAVAVLADFAKSEENYERDWQADLEQFAMWLGIAIS